MLIPLKYFIDEYLDNLYIKNIFTGKQVNANKIFNWQSSGALDILISNGYMIETKYNYATDEKEFGLVKVSKTKKVIGYKEDTIITPIETRKYRYVLSDEIKGYRTVIKPVYKYVKIGRQTFYTTQYKRVKTPIYRKVREYYTVVDYDYKVVKTPITKTYYKYKKIMHENYIPYMLYEKYKYDSANGKVEQSLFIAPFYSSHGQAFGISKGGNDYKPEFCLPEEIPQTQEYKDFLTDCKSLMFQNTTHKESLALLKQHIKNYKKKDNYKASYSYSEDIIDIVFFTYSKTNDNTQTVTLTEEEFNKELENND